MSQTSLRINIPSLVGRGYGAFWRTRKRYRVVKGSRASKKSKTIALWYMSHLEKYPLANLLVVRRSGRTLQDSCWAELQWAAERLHIEKRWKFTLNPLRATNLDTGQVIIFRGLDDPLKATSTTVKKGFLCWLWVEEAYEILKEKDFDTLDESIRGEVPEGYFKQITLSFNPWNDRHWLKARFFDNPSPDVFSATTSYLCNEFLDDGDKQVFENMKTRNPRRYQVAGLGNWGIVEGLVYENWREEEFVLEDLPKDAKIACGLDYGYTNDPTAFIVVFYSASQRKLYVWDEFYQEAMSNRAIFDEISRMKYGKESIVADSAEPKSNDELRRLGLRVRGAKKGPDSVNFGIQWIQDLEIAIHPRCVNFMTEISNYGFEKDKFGKKTNRPIDDFNHLMDAMRYGLEGFIRPSKTDHSEYIRNMARAVKGV